MANLAQAVNVLQALILTEGERMILTPTYHVFDLYKNHQNAELCYSSIADEKQEGYNLPCYFAERIGKQRQRNDFNGFKLLAYGMQNDRSGYMRIQF